MLTSHNDSPSHAVWFAAKPVAHHELEQSTEQRSYLVRGNHEAQQRWIRVAKGLEELLGSGQTTHVAKVIPEKQETDGATECDSVH